MVLNKATRVTAAICWMLIVICGYRLCERNERHFFPSARKENLLALCKQATPQAKGQRRRTQILTDREAAALNQRKIIFCGTQPRDLWILNYAQHYNADECTQIASTRAAGRKN